MIYYSYQILTNNIASIFYIRELSLLSIDEYVISYQDKADYRTISSLKKIAECSQAMIQYILTTSISLSKENELLLYNNTHY